MILRSWFVVSIDLFLKWSGSSFCVPSASIVQLHVFSFFMNTNGAPVIRMNIKQTASVPAVLFFFSRLIMAAGGGLMLLLYPWCPWRDVYRHSGPCGGGAAFRLKLLIESGLHLYICPLWGRNFLSMIRSLYVWSSLFWTFQFHVSAQRTRLVSISNQSKFSKWICAKF